MIIDTGHIDIIIRLRDINVSGDLRKKLLQRYQNFFGWTEHVFYWNECNQPLLISADRRIRQKSEKLFRSETFPLFGIR